MIVTERELTILHYLEHGHDDINEVSELMGVTPTMTYAAVRSMKYKGLLDKRKGIHIAPNAFAVRLQHMMGFSVERAKCLSDSALDILAALREHRTVDELISITGISRSTLFRYIKSLSAVGAIRSATPGYELNDIAWVDLRKVLDSMSDYQEVIDPRVRCGAQIYSVSKEAVVYSTDTGGPGQRTAFSYFNDRGDPGIVTTEYLTTYEGGMDLQRAFDDAYAVTEVVRDHRLRLSLISAYLRHGDSIDPPEGFLEVYRRLEAGERILRWPNLSEVRAKMEEGL